MKHRRKILLINPKFQLKYSFFVCSWTIILALAFPMVIYTAVDTFMRIVSRKIDATTLKVVENFQAEMITVTVLFMVVFGVTIFLISIFLSHRIAGPVYRVQTALERWSRGSVEKKIKLRKSDNFRELADGYNAAAEQFYSLKEQAMKSSVRLQKISKELEPIHRAQLQEIIGEIQCIAQKSP